MKLLLDQQRLYAEVQEAYTRYESIFKDVQDAHDNYTEIIEDDDKFAKEEEWMEECQKTFLNLKLTVNDYQAKKEEVCETLEPEEQHNESKSDKEKPKQSRSSFDLEKPKLPKFTGDVRDYGVFKSDFMHHRRRQIYEEGCYYHSSVMPKWTPSRCD